MTVNKQSEIPTEGQFVAIWEHKGELWSGTYRYSEQGGFLEKFYPREGSWDRTRLEWEYQFTLPLHNARFFTL